MSEERIRIPHVGVDELPDLNVFVVVLAEDPMETGRRIELQRALDPDQQDKDQAMDTYCVSTSWGPSCYGGIEAIVLEGRNLTIVFQQKAANVLELPVKLVLDLVIDEPALVTLRAGLKRIFSDGASPGSFLV